MPSTAEGLLLFVVFLVPGFLNYLQRRRSVPQRALSPLVEVANFVTISVVANLIALGAFSVFRHYFPRHSPDIERLLNHSHTYALARPGYILAWIVALLTFSSMVAVIAGSRWRGLGRLAPVIVDVSAWYQVFEDVPDGSHVFLGCDLRDGTYVSGYLDWYNTDVDEVADRDLVLSAPITIRSGGESEESEFSRLIISAREITRLSVSYIDDIDAADAERKQKSQSTNGSKLLVGALLLAVIASVLRRRNN